MKKYIVTTTINPPTEATIKFSRLTDWTLIVVGDLKTPHELYEELDCTYLSPEIQESMYPELSKIIGWNSVQRRNIGFIYAYELGADVLATVDDDNVPYDDWGKELHIGKETLVSEYECENGVFDPFSVTNISQLWHRGYPIELIKTKNNVNYLGQKLIVPLIQADLVDGDPDVDAIERLLYNHNVLVTKPELPFYSSQLSPFNSQNVFIHRDLIPYYAVIPFTGRMDDIWASYILQSKFPNSLIYSKASVIQKRNPHNLISDLKMEIIGYEKTFSLIKDTRNYQKYLPKKSVAFLDLYSNHFKITVK